MKQLTNEFSLSYKPVTVVENSENTKTGLVHATYASQSTCPIECSFYKNGCYAESGYAGITTNKLNNDEEQDELTIAYIEADGISKLSGKHKLRVHVVGDCKTNESAQIVGQSMKEFQNFSGKEAWTYTHAWRNVFHSSWKGANVSASCETGQEVKEAQSLGYGTVITVPEHLSNKKYTYQGVDIIPCPQQFGKTDCSNCNLCMMPQTLRAKGLSIGFAVHGNKKNIIKEWLERKVND